MEDNNFMEVLKENKGKILFLIICIALSIAFGFFGKSRDDKKVERMDVNEAAKQLATVYYTESFYKEIENIGAGYKDYLAAVKDDGIKVYLNNMLSTVENINLDLFFNDEFFCDYNSSYVMIYPIGEYNKNDFTVETYMDCPKVNNSESGEEE